MKKIISAAMLVMPVFILVFCSGSISADHNSEKKVITLNNIAVIELFTSQGCSSCPAADRLLGSLANREDIIALSFHVDYWNRLGWKDPFSNPAFSERQKQYASSFRASGIYTPQLIINGEKEMVGNDGDKIARTLKQLHRQASSSKIIIDELKSNDNKVSITYSINGMVTNSVVNVALVQNKITTSIKAGENEGVNLTNYNVVRNFKIMSTFKEVGNTITVDLVPGIDKKEFSIILFLQDATSNKIYTAIKSSL